MKRAGCHFVVASGNQYYQLRDLFPGCDQELSFVAENERENIRARQAEGIAAAKKNGVVFGRPKREYSPEFLGAVNDFLSKKISLAAAVEITGTSVGNFYYHLHKIKGDKRGN